MSDNIEISWQSSVLVVQLCPPKRVKGLEVPAFHT